MRFTHISTYLEILHPLVPSKCTGFKACCPFTGQYQTQLPTIVAGIQSISLPAIVQCFLIFHSFTTTSSVGRCLDIFHYCIQGQTRTTRNHGNLQFSRGSHDHNSTLMSCCYPLQHHSDTTKPLLKNQKVCMKGGKVESIVFCINDALTLLRHHRLQLPSNVQLRRRK